MVLFHFVFSGFRKEMPRQMIMFVVWCGPWIHLENPKSLLNPMGVLTQLYDWKHSPYVYATPPLSLPLGVQWPSVQYCCQALCLKRQKKGETDTQVILKQAKLSLGWRFLGFFWSELSKIAKTLIRKEKYLSPP